MFSTHGEKPFQHTTKSFMFWRENSNTLRTQTTNTSHVHSTNTYPNVLHNEREHREVSFPVRNNRDVDAEDK